MESGIIATSLGIGAVIFAGLVVFWFIHANIKKRLGTGQSVQLASSTQATNWEEKRKHERVTVSWPATMKIPERRIQVQLKNISLGGAFIICQEPLAIKERLRLDINAPHQDAFALNAEVVWSNTHVPQEKVIHRGMGVRFVQNQNEDLEHLNNTIDFHLSEKSQRPSRL
jgi:hypothetical protein